MPKRRRLAFRGDHGEQKGERQERKESAQLLLVCGKYGLGR